MNLDTMTSDAWDEVIVPSPVEIPNHKRGKSIKTRAHESRLFELLKAPPSDFDGSNRKLAEYMGLSQRSIIRILNCLKQAGKLRVKISRTKHPQFGFFTYRQMQIRKEA